MDAPRSRTLFVAGLVALALPLAVSAAAQQYQQYWLPNGPGGTTLHNPQGSWQGTVYENMLQRHAWPYQQRRLQGRESGAGATPARPAAAAPGLDPSFRIVNRDAATLQEIYVSSAHDRGWGPDRLGQDVLIPGRAALIRLPAGQCLNDIRVVYADGRAIERRRVNTCALSQMAFP